jgi:hypothetical protein
MATIIDQLQSEFSSQLVFEKRNVRNITHPGQKFRVGDKIGFQPFAKNISSAITIKDISGCIRQAAATSFTSYSFSVPRLGPGDEKSLGAEIEATIVADTNDFVMHTDRTATIDATGTVDLSAFKFQDYQIWFEVINPA